MTTEQGKLIIISAPSGTGKSTIINAIIDDESLRLSFSTSATTRQPREGEVDGKDYYFMSVEQFKAAIANDEFAEYQEVYAGRYYGTLKREIARITGQGRNVMLDIDVLGGINVKRMYGETALSLFILPPSLEVLRQRLTDRGTDSAEEIEKRLAKAEFEIGQGRVFDRQIVNDDLATAVSEVRQTIARFVGAG